MSFYLAHPAEANISQTVSPAVKDRGLSYFKAKPCDVQVAVLPYSIQPGYMCYVKNLCAFMEATLSGRDTFICNRGYPTTEVPHLLPIPIPSLIYDYPKALPNNKVEKLREHSTQIDGMGKSKSYVMQDVTLEKVRALVDSDKTINAKTRHVIGTVNLDALKSVFVIQKILSAFLLTHVYPAFRHSDDIAPQDDTDLMTVVTKKRKISTSSYVACVSDINKYIEESSEDEMEEREESEDPEPDRTDIQLTKAKPTRITGPTWGSKETIPNASGLYVPYVKDLSVADTVTLPTLIANTFVRSLSSTQQGMFEQLEKLRSAWGLIATTEFGHEVSHLSKCIDIALQAQAAIYPVYHNNIYEGSVIFGAGFNISVRGKSIEPIAYADLQALVSESSAHSKAIREITQAVDQGPDIFAECDSMRALSAIVKGLGLDEITRQTIIKAAHKLSFVQKYWSTSIPNIMQMVELLFDSEKEISVDIAMHPNYLFSSDRVEMVLSAFGHQAPTFMISGGQKCELKVEQPPKNFHVRTTTVENAVLDMKYLIENGYITNNVANLSSKHRDHSINSANKTEMWAALRKLHGAKKEAVKQKSESVSEPGGMNAGDDLW